MEAYTSSFHRPHTGRDRGRALVACVAVLFAAGLFAASLAAAQPRLTYLPPAVTYDPEVPTPSSVLGFEVGEWHVRHDQLAAYMRALAESSDRVRIEETGRTHEHRPLLLLTISAPENLARRSEIRQAHLALSDPNAEAADTSDMPVVVNLGYSVHGNEASGSNASLLVAYYLAAGQSETIDSLLAEAVILLDPSLNPDGLSRFAQWANMHRGRVPVADPNHREHREGWPNGRTNHYWFDLNRDWLLAQHPESRARLEQFHRWRPNVLIDAHENAANATYFYQPGVPVRKNPLTPRENVTLTGEIARYHAEALDRIGSLYYSEETFDDFYYGKGSTYPDLHGAVGILFEQASVRGHRQQTPNGELSFPFAIRNQLATTLSTLRAAHDKRRELLDYQRSFYDAAREQANDEELEGWVFGDPRDAARNHHFLELLRRHGIEVHALGELVEIAGQRFEPGSAWVVPTLQPQYLLLRTLFERRLDFADSTFYDVSTWTAPLAFNMPHAELRRKGGVTSLLGERVERPELPAAAAPADEPAYAFAFAWDGYYAPRALHRLLAAGVKARVATRPFTAATAGGEVELDPGTILVPMGIQTTGSAQIRQLAGEIARRDAVEVHTITSGLTPEGIDLGSPSLKPLKRPKVALAIGRGVNTYAAGEVWHLLDRRHEMPVSLIEHRALADLDLTKYTHLILVDGRYKGWPAELGPKLWRWVRRGGVLIASQRSIPWVDAKVRKPENGAPDARSASTSPTNGRADTATPAASEPRPPERRPYGEAEKHRAAKLISGAIFEVDLDVTHPLAYGYRRPTLPVFRNREVFLAPEKDPYVTVAAYRSDPLLSGYVSGENLIRLSGTPALTARRVGKGVVVRMADSPSFRAFWYGTDKLLMNAIFFGPVLEDTARPARGRRDEHE